MLCATLAARVVSQLLAKAVMMAQVVPLIASWLAWKCQRPGLRLVLTETKIGGRRMA
jgi:hypothetical protein